MAWGFVAQMLISMAVTYLAGRIFADDQKTQKLQQSKNLNPDQMPTINEGDAIPVVFGTQKLARPNIIFYGGLTTQGAGPAGYYYYLDLDLAFCHGPIYSLNKVYWGDYPVTTGYGTTMTVAGATVTISGGYSLPLSRGSETSHSFCLWAPDLFGGSQREGGTGGGGDIIWGSQTATLVPTYPDVSDPVPGHYGIFRLHLPGWYLGTQPQPKTVGVEVSRYPKGLTSSDYYSQIDGDANPIECIYEILTDTVWGLAMPSSTIDTTSWTAATQQVKLDGLGCSFTMTSQEEADAVINDLMTLVDGIIYSDPSTGKLKIKLLRADYYVESIPSFSESNIVSFESLVPWYSETSNDVCVSYQDRNADYRERAARAQDLANQGIQGQVVSESKKFRGVSRGAVAQFLAARELRVLSTPLMRCTIKTTRIAWDMKPGDPFTVTWTEAGISSKVMRVVRINYGSLEDGIIEIEGIEDVFSISTGIYTAPGDPTGGSLGTPGNVVRPFIAYLPHEIRPTETGEYFIFMAGLGANSKAVRLWIQDDYPSDPHLDTGLIWPGTCLALSQTTVDVESDLVDIAPSGITIDIESGSFPFVCGEDYTDVPLGRGVTMFCEISTGFNNRTSIEWYQFTRAEQVTSTQYTLHGVNRLLSYSSEPKAITSGSTRFFFPGFNDVSGTTPEMHAIVGPYPSKSVDHDVKFQSFNSLQSQAVASLSGYAVTTTIDPLIPIRPANVRFNSFLYPSSNIGGSVTISWYHRNRLEHIIYRQDQLQQALDSNYYYDLEVYTSTDGYTTPQYSGYDLPATLGMSYSASLSTGQWAIGDYLKYKIRTYYLDPGDGTTKVYGPDVEFGGIQRQFI